MKKLILEDGKMLIHTHEAISFKSRLLGYMFQKQPVVPSIIFMPCNSIHTFFMRFNIDVIFLNKDMEVIKILYNVPPRRIILPVKESTSVIEAKADQFKAVKLGDKIVVI